jgi:hypothetical protein
MMATPCVTPGVASRPEMGFVPCVSSLDRGGAAVRGRSKQAVDEIASVGRAGDVGRRRSTDPDRDLEGAGRSAVSVSGI